MHATRSGDLSKASFPEEVHPLQRDVQRLLGRCLLRLQQYERLLKAIVAHHVISGPADALEALQDSRVEAAATQTLGMLVGRLFGSCIVTESDGCEETEDALPDDVISFRMRAQLQLSPQNHAEMRTGLQDLVSLRNRLVHHFIDQHDLWSVDGCHAAQESLESAYARIDRHYEQLRAWAEHLEQARHLLAEFMQSAVFYDQVVNGIAPDGTVDWPAAGIVRTLREAFTHLAVEGWAPVAIAGRWIVDRHPEQLPAKYGCSSWRQVVHTCRLFELRYRVVDGQRAAWYRPHQA
jgi:hypothetical protein